jgi:hypothetical protein
MVEPVTWSLYLFSVYASTLMHVERTVRPRNSISSVYALSQT